MNLANVIEAFSFPERFPIQAVRACLAKPGDSVPAFLDHLRLCADNRLHRADEDAVFLMTHMLAELGEQRAFQPLMDFLTGDQERVERVFGDAVTETLCQVVISVYDGDESRLYEAMNTPSVEQFLRDAVFRAWIYLVATGRIDRDEARDYLADCFRSLQPRGESHIWASWTDSVSHLGFEELTPMVREAFDDGRVEKFTMKFRHFEQDLERGREPGSRMALLEEGRIHPFRDTIGTLSKWHCYSEEHLRRTDPLLTGPPLNDNAVNPFKTVGRNDPCPCGSGKKYKKCCLT